MKHKERFICNSCNEHTRLDIKTKKMFGEFEHVYAQCEHCGYKSTVYYTNKHVRKLMSKQKVERDLRRKQALEDKLKREVDMLKIKFEG